MTVYVDNARIPATVGRIRARWSHLTADNTEELHAFAARIGLRRAWFQTCKRPCHKTLPCSHWHYDVTESKRTEAIAAGAKSIDIREMAAITTARRVGPRCYYCGPTDNELRPYGPGGSTVCFPCATATPERERAAQGAFGALLDATSSVGLTAIGTEAGPINVDPEDIDRATRAAGE